MKFLDIILALCIAWFAFKGFRKGFVEEVFALLALLLAAWCAVPVSAFIRKVILPTTEGGYLFGLALSFLLCILIVFLAGRLFKISLNFVLPDFFDKLLGAAFGAFKVMFCAGILFYCITSADRDGKLLSEEKKAESVLFEPCRKTTAFLIPKIIDFKTFMEKSETFQKVKDKQNSATDE